MLKLQDDRVGVMRMGLRPALHVSLRFLTACLLGS